MSPQIQNDQQLEQMLMDLTEIALEKAADKILEEFKTKFLEPIVFNSHGSNQVYSRTGQFEESWQWSNLKREARNLSKEMFYNPKGMTLDRGNFIHGSNYPPNDARSNLMDILNKSGYSSSLWVSVNRTVPFWDVFILSAFQGGLLDKIISQEFANLGFKKV